VKDTIVFVANGFTKENARLQPWRYVYELALSRAKECNVYVITEGSSELITEEWQPGFSVIQTSNLNIKTQEKLLNIILALNPTELWWSTTPRSIAYYSLLSKIQCKCVAFITCPLYTWKELARASLAKIPFVQTKALWLQRLVPRFFFKWMLNKNFIDKVLVQSEKNRKIIEELGVNKNKLDLLPVGIDKEDIEPVDSSLIDELVAKHTEISGKVVYLYFGALRPIRGFDALMEAFPKAVAKNPDIHLIVLARGAEQSVCDKLINQLTHLKLQDNITVIGGWLTRQQVWAYIEISDAAVLPFVLVPSDIPIAVLEAMARGKPVVVSHVDGLPEMARGRGVIVDPLNANKFAEQLYLLSIDNERRLMLGKAAKSYMDKYPCWDDVGIMAKEMSVIIDVN